MGGKKTGKREEGGWERRKSGPSGGYEVLGTGFR